MEADSSSSVCVCVCVCIYITREWKEKARDTRSSTSCSISVLRISLEWCSLSVPLPHENLLREKSMGSNFLSRDTIKNKWNGMEWNIDKYRDTSDGKKKDRAIFTFKEAELLSLGLRDSMKYYSLCFPFIFFLKLNYTNRGVEGEKHRSNPAICPPPLLKFNCNSISIVVGIVRKVQEQPFPIISSIFQYFIVIYVICYKTSFDNPLKIYLTTIFCFCSR